MKICWEIRAAGYRIFGFTKKSGVWLTSAVVIGKCNIKKFICGTLKFFALALLVCEFEDRRALCKNRKHKHKHTSMPHPTFESLTTFTVYRYTIVFSSCLTAFIAKNLVGTKRDSICISPYNVVVDISRWPVLDESPVPTAAYTSTEMYLTSISARTTVYISFWLESYSSTTGY